MMTLHRVARLLEAEFCGQPLDRVTEPVMLARARELWPTARALYIDEAGRLHIVAGPAPVLQFAPVATQ